MKINKGNVIDCIGYYMEDNQVDYVSIRASLGRDGNLIMVISDDIEFEDYDDDD